jgi:hypothetical protein
MSQLSSTRHVVIAPVRVIGALIAIGLLAAALFSVAVMLRPVVGDPTLSRSTVVQVAARDDFALRQASISAFSDDYGLRHTATAAVATTWRSDDYGLRHPSSGSDAGQSQDSTDFGLRHSTWTISTDGASNRDDYGLR